MKRIGMLFPDYGSQYVGMAKELYDNSRSMQEYFEEASNCLNVNFVKLCFASSDSELSKIENAYTALFLTSTAIAAFLKEHAIRPFLVAGYGIGEFSAIHVAGGLSLPDGLYLLNKYAHFFQEKLSSLSAGLLHVERLKEIKIKKVCSLTSNLTHEAYIAACNAAEDYLIAGTADVLTTIAQGVKENGGVSAKDKAERGLHGYFMEDVVTNLKKYLTKVDFRNLTLPLVSSIDGQNIEKGDLVKRRLMKQLQSTVRWDKVMFAFRECDIILEVGPGSTLTKIIKTHYPSLLIYPMNKKSDFQELLPLLELAK